jgi:saccharopine dehydrogenase-like NADP-dependent oxidoreductase
MATRRYSLAPGVRTDVITAPPSLTDLLFSVIAAGKVMPAVAVEGAQLNTTSIGSYASLPDHVRSFVVNTYLAQRPLNAGTTQTAVSAGGAFSIVFAPNVGLFPGVWDSYVYGVLAEIDFSNNIAKSPVDITVQGFGSYEQTINIQGITGQPLATTQAGTSKVRMWFFPGEQSAGSAVWTPWSFRPALSAAPLNVPHTLTVAMAAGLTTGAAVTAHLLCRGNIEVDTMVNLVAQADYDATQVAYRAAAALQRG